jgi:hypothetical protein
VIGESTKEGLVMEERFAEIRRLADLIQWARGTDDPWDGAPDYQPDSIHAKWVAALSPEVVIELLDRAGVPSDG